MKLSEALHLLHSIKVPEHFYAVGGLGGGECIGISFENGIWFTYFSEKGNRSNLQKYSNESDAVNAFLAGLEEQLDAYKTGIRIPLLP